MRVEGSKEKSVILNGSFSLKEGDLQLHLEVRGLKQQVDILNIFYGYFFIREVSLLICVTAAE